MTPYELFEANEGLAVHLAEKYAKRWPRVDLDELCQQARIALWSACRRHNPKSKVPFGADAMKGILWAIWNHCNRYGYPSTDLSLDEIVGSSDNEPVSRPPIT